MSRSIELRYGFYNKHPYKVTTMVGEKTVVIGHFSDPVFAVFSGMQRDPTGALKLNGVPVEQADRYFALKTYGKGVGKCSCQD